MQPINTFYDNYLKGNGSIYGTGLLGFGAYSGYKSTIGQLPRGGVRKLVADQASNFLEGFYRPGADKQALYREELGKSLRRSATTLSSPLELATYKGTGVSSFLNDTILDMEKELKRIDMDYAEGKYGQSGETAIDKVKKAKNRIIKERHYKILNDSANTEIFDSKKSRLLENYRNRIYKQGMTPWHKIMDSKDFVKTSGDKRIAEYVLNRHRIGASELPFVGKAFKPKVLSLKTPKVKFLKWFDHSISGVMRGGQFNVSTYHLLEKLKNGNFDLNKAKLEASKVRGVGGIKSMNNKLYFSFSPSWKSNFDWGGYNVVAEWNPKNKGQVRFIGTDLRDTPISTVTRGNHVVNYVESKKFNIADLKEEVVEEPRKLREPRGVDKQKRVRRTNLELKEAKRLQRLQNISSGTLESKGVYPRIREDINNISKQRAHYKTGITVKNFSKKLGRLKLGGKGAMLTGAALLAQIAYDKYRE